MQMPVPIAHWGQTVRDSAEPQLNASPVKKATGGIVLAPIHKEENAPRGRCLMERVVRPFLRAPRAAVCVPSVNWLSFSLLH